MLPSWVTPLLKMQTRRTRHHFFPVIRPYPAEGTNHGPRDILVVEIYFSRELKDMGFFPFHLPFTTFGLMLGEREEVVRDLFSSFSVFASDSFFRLSVLKSAICCFIDSCIPSASTVYDRVSYTFTCISGGEIYNQVKQQTHQ